MILKHFVLASGLLFLQTRPAPPFFLLFFFKSRHAPLSRPLFPHRVPFAPDSSRFSTQCTLHAMHVTSNGAIFADSAAEVPADGRAATDGEGVDNGQLGLRVI
eukprot:83739-Rhodomonas_salina.1